MHSTTSTDTAQNTQAQKTSKAKKVSPEVQARREAVWKGEHCPRLVDSVNMSRAITQLNIGKYGNVINLCWTLSSKLTRTKKTDDLGRESVWVDLKESRFDSMDTCAENMGLTRRAMEKVFQYAKELDIIRNTGASGKRTREYAFGDAMIKALTGEPTMHRGNKKPAKRIPESPPGGLCGLSPNYEKAGQETPLSGALETPLSGVLVLKDLVSQEDKNTNTRRAGARKPKPETSPSALDVDVDILGLRTESRNPEIPNPKTPKPSPKKVLTVVRLVGQDKKPISEKDKNGMYYEFIDKDGVGRNPEDELKAQKEAKARAEQQKRAKAELLAEKRRRHLSETQAAQIRETFDDKVGGFHVKEFRSEFLKRVYTLYDGDFPRFLRTLRDIHVASDWSYAEMSDENNWPGFLSVYEALHARKI